MTPDDGTKPDIAFTIVVFPAPFVPMRPTTSPLRTSSETSSTIVRPPNVTESPFVMRGVPVVTTFFPEPSEATAAPSFRTGGVQFERRAIQFNKLSRPEWTIEINPLGKYNKTINMPKPLAKSSTCLVPSKNRGTAMMSKVPKTAPVIDPIPPTTATDTMRSDSSKSKSNPSTLN